MDLRSHIDAERLHHAYLIEGERVAIISELTLILEEAGVVTLANPDFHLYEHDAFLIEHAHTLRREQSMHASAGAHKVFVVAFNTMLSEAQNALLKTLEEPTVGTHFFFITRTGEVLLPTVRSRMQVVKNQTPVTSHGSREKNAGEDFLKATIPERLKIIEHFTKAKTDEKSAAKESARVFLESLERALYAKISEETPPKAEESPLKLFAQALENVLTAKRYLSDRSPSVKLLLEHLALTVPLST